MQNSFPLHSGARRTVAAEVARGCRWRSSLVHRDSLQQPNSRKFCHRSHSQRCRAIQHSFEEPALSSHDDASSSGSMDSAYLAALPQEWQRAVDSGKVDPEVQQRYAALQRSPLLAPLLRWQGFEERLLADPSFMTKVGIEVGIGICTKTTAEATKRGPMFFAELDFVLANVIMALLADFCLVWLPAPCVSWRGRKDSSAAALQSSALYGLVQSCPGNCFQTVQPGAESYTLQQRLGSLVVNGAKLLAVGTSASLVGVGLVNTLIHIRQNLDPSWTPLNPPQDILATSLYYGLYMGVSSNLRYQIIAGVIEERGIEQLFKGNAKLCGILSFLVRTSNTFIGSLLWIDFVRLLGMQSASPH